MFASSFKVGKGFKAVRKDMTALKESMSEWTLYTQKNQLEFEERLSQIEQRLARIDGMISQKTRKK
ncbi:hypothetical protein HN695_00280 [Candidatus Woesearchaeota archaeon]|jgi:hypothetical protein|nr:hypothetical protein [Candidatus Woesearchaeota archaeon]MBT5272543.1 hypothetical protein [Candidatus Woesearchaeota archaeon]MBT6041067.1 hypothetical protein [Candidatus Woesearchaeota archaeon]MBT6337095.1 hypothetical protein [Candidatus Woesearchaeota archaeon]MBT7926750.1 hypothetical protein [Candidatus Woesearchaeota archaeon]